MSSKGHAISDIENLYVRRVVTVLFVCTLGLVLWVLGSVEIIIDEIRIAWRGLEITDQIKHETRIICKTVERSWNDK